MWWVCRILTSIIFDDSIACPKQNIFETELLALLWPTSAHQKWPTKPIWQKRLGKFKELHVSYFNKSGRKRYSMSCLKQFGLQCDENSNSLMWVGALIYSVYWMTWQKCLVNTITASLNTQYLFQQDCSHITSENESETMHLHSPTIVIYPVFLIIWQKIATGGENVQLPGQLSMQTTHQQCYLNA